MSSTSESSSRLFFRLLWIGLAISVIIVIYCGFGLSVWLFESPNPMASSKPVVLVRIVLTAIAIVFALLFWFARQRLSIAVIVSTPIALAFLFLLTAVGTYRDLTTELMGGALRKFVTASLNIELSQRVKDGQMIIVDGYQIARQGDKVVFEHTTRPELSQALMSTMRRALWL